MFKCRLVYYLTKLIPVFKCQLGLIIMSILENLVSTSFSGGLARLFRDARFATFYRRDIWKVDLKIAGNGMRYTQSTGNDMIARSQVKQFRRDKVKYLFIGIPFST